MNKTWLKTPGGSILGYLTETYDSGRGQMRRNLHNIGGTILGFYTLKDGQTFTVSGQPVGNGDLLATLLPRR